MAGFIVMFTIVDTFLSQGDGHVGVDDKCWARRCSSHKQHECVSVPVGMWVLLRPKQMLTPTACLQAVVN